MRLNKSYGKKLIMKGLFLNDPEIMSYMDRELLTKGKSEIIEISAINNTGIDELLIDCVKCTLSL